MSFNGCRSNCTWLRTLIVGKFDTLKLLRELNCIRCIDSGCSSGIHLELDKCRICKLCDSLFARLSHVPLGKLDEIIKELHEVDVGQLSLTVAGCTRDL